MYITGVPKHVLAYFWCTNLVAFKHPVSHVRTSLPKVEYYYIWERTTALSKFRYLWTAKLMKMSSHELVIIS